MIIMKSLQATFTEISEDIVGKIKDSLSLLEIKEEN
jgi:hypothetical protein